jgi:hypothetical protein
MVGQLRRKRTVARSKLCSVYDVKDQVEVVGFNALLVILPER